MKVDLTFKYLNYLLIFAAEPQMITPKDLGFTTPKPGFGYSLSKDKVDVDENNCNDFAVGYPNSNQAILLRSKEVVILEESSRFPNYQSGVTIKDREPIDPPTNPINPSKLIIKYEKKSFSN